MESQHNVLLLRTPFSPITRSNEQEETDQWREEQRPEEKAPEAETICPPT